MLASFAERFGPQERTPLYAEAVEHLSETGSLEK